MNPKYIIFLILFLLLFLSKVSHAEKLYMLTDKNCLYCMVWEKEIGKIYPKTDISKQYPLSRVYVNNDIENLKQKIFNTNLTPTFVFVKDNKEIGRIEGFSNPEMFWWQVDEIIENY
ncbi:MAG: thioredoxin family protein [Bacteroidetes bacterium]|jgi:thioredoxin-related protein|nr:thioredoxin family protein [Bacteroidota bacterium]MDA3037835.1 thioredoxin family protein [Actinomycetota bacterium]